MKQGMIVRVPPECWAMAQRSEPTTAMTWLRGLGGFPEIWRFAAANAAKGGIAYFKANESRDK